MPDKKMSVGRAVFFVIIAMFSIQLGASFAKSLFPVAGPIGTSFLRISIAAIILMLAFKPWKTSIGKKEIKLIIAYGLSLGLMNLTFYISLERIPLGVAVAIEFIGPLLVAVLSSRKWTDFVWVLLAVIGLSLLLPIDHGLAEGVDLIGALFALVAGLFWGLYIFFGGKLAKVPGTVASSYGMVVAALTVLPFGMFSLNPEAISMKLLLSGIAVALLSSAIPYSLEMFAMKAIPSKNFGILMSIEPVIATLSGFVILHEVLTGYQILAIAFIVVASLGSVIGSKGPHPAEI